MVCKAPPNQAVFRSIRSRHSESKKYLDSHQNVQSSGALKSEQSLQQGEAKKKPVWIELRHETSGLHAPLSSVDEYGNDNTLLYLSLALLLILLSSFPPNLPSTISHSSGIEVLWPRDRLVKQDQESGKLSWPRDFTVFLSSSLFLDLTRHAFALWLL